MSLERERDATTTHEFIDVYRLRPTCRRSVDSSHHPLLDFPHMEVCSSKGKAGG
jgi:hypothetical protein